MLKSIQGKIGAQVCLRRGKWDGAQRCGAFGDGSNLRRTSPERHKGSWVSLGEGIRQARGLEWANQHWMKSLSDLTLDETQDGRSNNVTWGGCVCVRVAFFVCQWALSTLHLPMSKHPLMPMDCAQSSVRASKSSTGERNSHQHKLPKEGANVPPINILKVSPMLSGNIAGWHAWVKITSLHHAEGRVGLPNVYIWFQKWWIQSLWHPISFLKQDLLLQWPQSRKKTIIVSHMSGTLLILDMQ